MPAAAVIPAPIAYINVVAVKKLVVEFLGLKLSQWLLYVAACTLFLSPILVVIVRGIKLSCAGAASFTMKKSARSKHTLICIEYSSME